MLVYRAAKEYHRNIEITVKQGPTTISIHPALPQPDRVKFDQELDIRQKSVTLESLLDAAYDGGIL